MRNVCKIPSQLDLQFESTNESDEAKLDVEMAKLSNVVSINFAQKRDLKQRGAESNEDELMLEYVLSNARKLSW